MFKNKILFIETAYNFYIENIKDLFLKKNYEIEERKNILESKSSIEKNEYDLIFIDNSFISDELEELKDIYDDYINNSIFSIIIFLNVDKNIHSNFFETYEINLTEQEIDNLLNKVKDKKLKNRMLDPIETIIYDFKIEREIRQKRFNILLQNIQETTQNIIHNYVTT